MSHSVSVLDASENKQDFFIEQIQIHDCPTSLPSAQSNETQVDQLLNRMRSIGEEYLKRIQSAALEFVDRVQQTAGSSGPFSRRYKSNIQLEIQDAKSAFDGNVLDAAGHMKIQHEMLNEEMESLKGRWSGEIFEKVIQTEALVLDEDVRIQRMVEDPTVELGYLMRAYATNREMKAYLQGLKFLAGGGVE
jgi:hypothetical protein